MASESGLLPVLKNRSFLALWSGQVFSQLADKIYLVLMIALIANRIRTPGETVSGWVSAIMVAFTIPAILFGSVAGVFVDRWPKQAVLVITNFLRGGLVLGLPLLLRLTDGMKGPGSIPVQFYVLLSITFLVSTFTQFFAPAEQAAIPLIVKRHHLLPANSLYTMTMMAATIIGFAIGEPLLSWADAVTHHTPGAGVGQELVVGGSYGIAGVLLLLPRIRERSRLVSSALTQDGEGISSELSGEGSSQSSPVWTDLRDGFQYLSQQPRLRNALLQLVILFSIFAALAVLAVRLAEVLPEIRTEQFGWLLAAGAIGMGVGAITVGQFGKRSTSIRFSLWGSLGLGLCLAGMSLVTLRLWPMIVLIMAMGFCAGIVGVPMQTIIQAETPETMRGKVFGLQNNAVNIALSVPLVLAGVAEAMVGLRVVFLGLAGVAIAGGLVSWQTFRRKG